MNYLIIVYVFGSILTGSLFGLIISILFYPQWEVRKIVRKTSKMGKGLGEWVHADTFVDHTVRIVVKPNCEVLYSYAFVKMAEGPWRIKMKACDSYFCFTFLKENTNVLGYLSNSDYAEGEDINTAICLPPKRQKGKKIKEKILRAKTCWIIARFSIESEEDLERIISIQRSLTLERI